MIWTNNKISEKVTLETNFGREMKLGGTESMALSRTGEYAEESQYWLVKTMVRVLPSCIMSEEDR